MLFGIMGMGWRLRVSLLLVLHQVFRLFVGLTYFGEDGLRICHRNGMVALELKTYHNLSHMF